MKKIFSTAVLIIILSAIFLIIFIIAAFVIDNVIETNRYNEYIEGRNWDCFDDSERFIEHYKPMLIKSSIINGVFDEDLYQELCVVLMKCIEHFVI